MAPILDYIRDNLAEPLTLDQIAGRFFISKHYLCRIFKSATGFSSWSISFTAASSGPGAAPGGGSASSRRGSCPVSPTTPISSAPLVISPAPPPGRYAKEYQAGDQVLLRDPDHSHG